MYESLPIDQQEIALVSSVGYIIHFNNEYSFDETLMLAKNIMIV